MPEFQIPSSIVQNVGLVPTATTVASTAPVLAETARSGLFGFDPASIAFSLFVNSVLNKKPLLTETPMTAEEAAKFAGQQRLETALGGVGEGAGEFLLDAIEQARAANVTPEQVAETLNASTNPVADLINLTVGSNEMFVADAETTAAAQAASQAAADAAASGGGQTEETVDLGADTTANELLTGGLGNADTGGVANVNETWTYDKATDSFISNTRGDVFPNRGNATLKDGGIYAVTPVIGTDGVTAENVVDTETNESVGILNVDITTGLPSIIKTVDSGSSVSETDTFGTAQDTLNTGQTLGVGGGDLGGKTTGDTGFETARDTNNTGKTLTVGDTVKTTTPTVINGTNGVDGQDGRDGTDNKDGRDGMIGLFSRVINETPLTESILFPTKFTKLENVQQGMFGEFLRAAGGRR